MVNWKNSSSQQSVDDSKLAEHNFTRKFFFLGPGPGSTVPTKTVARRPFGSKRSQIFLEKFFQTFRSLVRSLSLSLSLSLSTYLNPSLGRLKSFTSSQRAIKK